MDDSPSGRNLDVTKASTITVLEYQNVKKKNVCVLCCFQLMMACASVPIDRLLECPICLETMKEPKLLYCGHSVCSSCMDNLTVGGVGSDVECPECRHHSKVPKDGFPTNFKLSDLIHRHISDQDKQSHKCMMCDRLSSSDDMIMCHSCGDMSLCWSCCFASHDGHQREKLQDHMNSQVKQLQQWKDDKVPVLESLTSFPTTIFNRCKALLDEQQTRQLGIGQKRTDFETKLHHLIDSSANELNAGNGYKFDFASLEEQLKAIQDEHKLSITKREEVADTLSKMLVSGDVSDVDHVSTEETGILFTEGQCFAFYSPNTKTAGLIDIKMERRDSFVMQALSDGKVLVAGGQKTITRSRQFAPTQIIDFVSKRAMQPMASSKASSKVPRMTTTRWNAASAMIGGIMYVCGGKDKKDNTLSSCEVFRDGKWMTIANMKVPRHAHAVVALDGLLYAIGGSNGIVRSIHSVECYSPDTNSWQSISPLNVPRAYFTAAASNGCIYVAGGEYYADISCERYCPNLKKWETVAHPKRSGPCTLVSCRDKLYALGGDGNRRVQSYDAQKNEWKMEGITLMMSCVRAVVLDFLPN